MARFLTLVAIVAAVFFAFRGNVGKEAMSRVVISDPTPVRTVPAEKRVRVILFTGTEWCPACTHLDSSVITTPAWQEFVRGELAFQKVDIPADRSLVKETDRLLVSRYDIGGYPTMVVVDRSGKELSRQVGSGAPVENYKEWIRRHTRYY